MQKYLFESSILGIQISPTWYGFMYVLGFTFCYLFMRKYSKMMAKELDTLLTYIFFGVVGGGRIGYALFYNLEYSLAHPLDILRIWEGGMSFHGGLLGVLIAVGVYAHIHKKSYFDITDPLAISIPVALGLGRVGNWINQELPGYSPYDGIFPMMIGGAPHFPSPLFQMFSEGIVLFIVMLYLWKKYDLLSEDIRGRRTQRGVLSAIFLIGYGISRLITENFRLPDPHIGYLLGTQWITLGMVYTIPLLIGGALILLSRRGSSN